MGEFFIRTKIKSGQGISEDVVKYIKLLKKDKILILTDKGVRNTGLPDKIQEIIKNAGISVYIIDTIQPDPTVELIDSIANKYNGSFSAIVAIGGGSTIDTAKGVSIVSTLGGSIREYVGENKFNHLDFPILAIPTTAGTGSEVSWHISINDVENEKKITVRNPLCSCDYALLDPNVIASVPPHIAAMTGVDAFAHNFESFVSNKGNWLLTHQLSKSGIEIIGNNLLEFVKNPTNKVAAENMLLASSIGGMVLSHARTGIVHQMARPLGAHFQVPHGLAVSLILPYAVKFLANSIKDKLMLINDVLPEVEEFENENSHTQAALKIDKFVKKLPIPHRLRDVGVTKDKIEQMAIDSLQGEESIFNPVKVSLNEVIMIYKAAY